LLTLAECVERSVCLVSRERRGYRSVAVHHDGAVRIEIRIAPNPTRDVRVGRRRGDEHYVGAIVERLDAVRRVRGRRVTADARRLRLDLAKHSTRNVDVQIVVPNVRLHTQLDTNVQVTLNIDETVVVHIAWVSVARGINVVATDR